MALSRTDISDGLIDELGSFEALVRSLSQAELERLRAVNATCVLHGASRSCSISAGPAAPRCPATRLHCVRVTIQNWS